MSETYEVRVEVVKDFTIKFPDNLFEESHMQDIRDYCMYNNKIDKEMLKERIIQAWCESGMPGYFEQFGAYIGYYCPCSYEEQKIPFIEISDPWTDVSDDIYMEEK